MTTIGRKRKIGIAIEPVAGTIESPTMQIPFLDLTLEPRHTPIGDVSPEEHEWSKDAFCRRKEMGRRHNTSSLNPKTSPTC